MNTWKDLIKENYTALADLCKKAEYDSEMNRIQGWSFDVVLDSDGTASVVGPRNNSESEREWNGLARKIYGATYDGSFGSGPDEESNAMAWLDADDPDVNAWIAEHETDEDNAAFTGLVWENGDFAERFFDDYLSDDLHEKAVRRYVYDNEQMDARIEDVLDWLLKSEDYE